MTRRRIGGAPIEDFMNDSDATPIIRLVAEQLQLPVYSRDVAAVHQSTSSINDGGTSLLHSGNPSLPAPTQTKTYSSSRSASSSIGNQVVPIRILKQYSQEPLSIPPPPGLITYECPFNYLHCLLTFSNPKDWYNHSLTHFDSIGPPLKAGCCFCDFTFSAKTGSRCWQSRMDHIKLHHRFGHRLSHARPEFVMYHYLWSKGIIDDSTYKYLNGDVADMRQKGKTIESPVNKSHGTLDGSRSLSGSDVTANVYTLNKASVRQKRGTRRQERLLAAQHRADSRSRNTSSAGLRLDPNKASLSKDKEKPAPMDYSSKVVPLQATPEYYSHISNLNEPSALLAEPANSPDTHALSPVDSCKVLDEATLLDQNNKICLGSTQFSVPDTQTTLISVS